MRRSKAEQRDIAERKLLESALNLVSARGAHRTSLADIAETAGFSRALPAHYFGNKEGLVSALVGFMLLRFRAVFVRGEKPREGIDAVLHRVDSYLLGAREEAQQFRALQILMSEATVDDGDSALRRSIISANDSALNYFEHQIQRGIEKGEIRRGIDPGAVAVILMGAMRGVLAQWFLDPNGIDLVSVQQQLRQFAQAALAPPDLKQD